MFSVHSIIIAILSNSALIAVAVFAWCRPQFRALIVLLLINAFAVPFVQIFARTPDGEIPVLIWSAIYAASGAAGLYIQMKVKESRGALFAGFYALSIVVCITALTLQPYMIEGGAWSIYTTASLALIADAQTVALFALAWPRPKTAISLYSALEKKCF